MGYDNETIAFSSVVAVQSGWWRLCKMAFWGLPSSQHLPIKGGGGRRATGLLKMGLRGRGRGGGLGGQQAVRARRSLGSRLLGGGPRIGGVQARAAFINLRVQLSRALEVNTVEHLKRNHTQRCLTTSPPVGQSQSTLPAWYNQQTNIYTVLFFYEPAGY